MDRSLSPETLIDYHFGTLPAAERAAVEQTLLASEDALRAYLQLKRTLDEAPAGEHAPAGDDLPSAAARARLRAAVAREVARPRPRWFGFLARPVPLYQTLAVAAAVALGVGVLRRPPVEPARPPVSPLPATAGTTVDLARPVGLDVL